MSLGILLKKARKKRGVTRQQLADEVRVNINSIAKYERAGEKNGQFPPLPTIARLCVALNVSSADVFLAVCETDEERNFFQVRMVHTLEKLASIFYYLEDTVASMEIPMEIAHDQLIELLPAKPDNEKFEEMLALAYPKGRGSGLIRNLYTGKFHKPKEAEENGPDQKDPSRSINSKNNTEAVDAAPTRPKKGQSDEAV